MTPEELMSRTRYKIIADYPGRLEEIGSIINTYDSAMSYAVGFTGPGGETLEEKICLEDFPNLFNKLEWWEDLKKEELPQYIRINEDFVTKVGKHGCIRKFEFESRDTKYCYPYGICTPATEQEYIEWKQKHKP